MVISNHFLYKDLVKIIQLIETTIDRWLVVWGSRWESLNLPSYFLSDHIWFIWVFPKIGTQKWMVKIMENPIKMDDLGVPLFSETPIYDSYDTLSLFKTISSI